MLSFAVLNERLSVAISASGRYIRELRHDVSWRVHLIIQISSRVRVVVLCGVGTH